MPLFSMKRIWNQSAMWIDSPMHIAPSVLTMDQTPQIVADSADGHQAEQTEHQFVEERHAIGHAVVLYEKDLEPVGNVDRLANAHVCLDPYLDGLVDDKQ